jgi:hypothetical protein
MSKRYFTLLSRGPDDTRWAIEFGDYDRDCVQQELEDSRDGFNDDEGVVYCIISTTDDQDAIDAKVSQLNANL